MRNKSLKPCGYEYGVGHDTLNCHACQAVRAQNEHLRDYYARQRYAAAEFGRLVWPRVWLVVGFIVVCVLFAL
jgi:hypothetical protein